MFMQAADLQISLEKSYKLKAARSLVIVDRDEAYRLSVDVSQSLEPTERVLKAGFLWVQAVAQKTSVERIDDSRRLLERAEPIIRDCEK